MIGSESWIEHTSSRSKNMVSVAVMSCFLSLWLIFPVEVRQKRRGDAEMVSVMVLEFQLSHGTKKQSLFFAVAAVV